MGLPRTFDALKVSEYRNYFVSMLFYLGAMQATTLARPVLAFELSVQDKPYLVREEYRASDREGEKESSYAPAFSREAEFSSLEFSPS